MMSDDDNDGQMIFRDLGGLKLPDICLTGEEKPLKNLTQATCHDRGSNPGPLRDRHACYHLAHSGGPVEFTISLIQKYNEHRRRMRSRNGFFLKLYPNIEKSSPLIRSNGTTGTFIKRMIFLVLFERLKT